MSTLFLKLLNMSMTAGWLILAVIILRLLLQKAPKWISCLLWAFVAIRLLCPVTIESTLSLLPSAEPVKEANIYSQEAVLDSGITFVDHMVNPIVDHAIAAAPAASTNPWDVRLFFGSLLWIAGILTMLGYAVISYVRIHEKTAASLPLRDNVMLCDEISTSFILGIVKPRIFIPSYLKEQQWKHMLAHEEAHIRRLDHWWKPLGFLILSVYWFHPLCWAAYILFCRDMELACDEKVIRDFALADKKEYSNTLLDCSIRQKNFTACPLAFGEIGVKKRISAVLNYKRPAFWVSLLAVAACIAAAACFLTNPPESNPEVIPEKNISETPPAKDMEEIPKNIDSLDDKSEINENTHLEMIRFDDYAPYYVLSFQKIEGKTGNLLSFEGNTELLDQKGIGPDNLTVKPEEGFGEFWYCFDGKENLADTVTMGFWNRGGEKSVIVELDGFEYEIVFPEFEQNELAVNQKITMDSTGATTLLETVTIYPKALLLKISGFNNENWDSRIFMEDLNSDDALRKAPKVVYEQETGYEYLLFLFEEEIPTESFTLQAAERRSKYPKDTIYHDTLISLE